MKLRELVEKIDGAFGGDGELDMRGIVAACLSFSA